MRAASFVLLLPVVLAAAPVRAVDEPSMAWLTKALHERPADALAMATTVAALNRFTSAQALRILAALPPADRLEALRRVSPKLDDGVAREQILALFPAGKERDEAASLVPVPPPPPATPKAAAPPAVPEPATVEKLLQDLAAANGWQRRFHVLEDHVRTQPTCFAAADARQVLETFSFDAKALEPLQVIEPRLLPLASVEVGEILRLFEARDRLAVLEVLQDSFADPAVTKPVLAEIPTLDLASATAVLAAARPRSAIYGTIRARSVVFLVDTSSSMQAPTRGGSRALDRVVRELGDVVARGLPANTTFAIGAFESDLRTWKPTLETPSDASRASAATFLGGLAPHGGTRLLPALQWAIGLAPAEVYVLSDGMPAERMDQLLQLVQTAAAQGTTVHAAFFGPSTAAAAAASKGPAADRLRGFDFMRRLATAGHGAVRAFE